MFTPEQPTWNFSVRIVTGWPHLYRQARRAVKDFCQTSLQEPRATFPYTPTLRGARRTLILSRQVTLIGQTFLHRACLSNQGDFQFVASFNASHPTIAVAVPGRSRPTRTVKNNLWTTPVSHGGISLLPDEMRGLGGTPSQRRRTLRNAQGGEGTTEKGQE